MRPFPVELQPPKRWLYVQPVKPRHVLPSVDPANHHGAMHLRSPCRSKPNSRYQSGPGPRRIPVDATLAASRCCAGVASAGLPMCCLRAQPSLVRVRFDPAPRLQGPPERQSSTDLCGHLVRPWLGEALELAPGVHDALARPPSRGGRSNPPAAFSCSNYLASCRGQAQPVGASTFAGSGDYTADPCR